MTMVHKIAKECIYYLQDLRGNERDVAVISFWCGAHAVLQASRHPSADFVTAAIALRIAPGKYAECLKIASEGDIER